MLTNLYVKNLALIDEADIDFDEGLTVLTGETGAGKSVIIGAINIALGAKLVSDIVRDESKEAVAQLGFYFDDKNVLSFLRERELIGDDVNELIIRRTISSGRSRFKINGCDVSSSQVKELAPFLLDLHAQRDNLRLLQSSEQLMLVDTFTGEGAQHLRNKISEGLSERNKLKEKIDKLGADDSARLRELDLLSFEAGELEEAELKLNEDEELEREFKRAENAGKIKEAALRGLSALANDSDCASSSLAEAIKNVTDICELSEDEEIKNIKDMLYDADSIISDCARELDAYAENTEADEERFVFISDRLNIYNRLKEKYRTDTAGLITLLDEKNQRINELENSGELIKEYEDKLFRLDCELKELCFELTAKRKAAAQLISERLVEAARDLNFNDVRFEIEVSEEDEITHSGNNRVSFMISLNPGEDLKPLKNVASGGELSRIMLAFKTITADSDGTETLIFDEIDTGISGRTAQRVAEKMARVAENKQIICITHLPQIAAMGEHHFLISKSVEDERSVTDIKLLDDKERIDELSRMLGGGEITDAVRRNAEEMIALARTYNS